MTSDKFTNPWLPFHKANSTASFRLFCFSYAGGSATIYSQWPAIFPSWIQICPVQIPGRGGRIREKPYTQLLPLVHAIYEGIGSQLDKPFGFFGHSLGSILGFELSRLLRANGQPLPAYLFASGSSAPTLLNYDRPTYALPEAEFIEELARLNGTPREVLEHPELMALLIPILRADFEVIQTYLYTPEPPLNCPIYVFGGLMDSEIPRENLEEWKAQTSGSFALSMLAGDHFFLNQNARNITEVICRELYKIGI
jgi:medium-chain acyl-[acyl-carrier-protein] hydrolase